MLNFREVDYNDSQTWDLICSGKTTGVFQLESGLGKEWSKTIKPRNLNELADLISVIRPGTLEAKENGKTMTQIYAERKAGIMPVVPMHPCLVGILDDTYHILVYQEQAMMIAYKVAGYSLQETDNLRKAIGKKDAALLSSLRESFVNGCIKTSGLTAEDANYIFDVIQKSARYSFNRSHAVAYAHVAYVSAYKKCHDRIKFYRSWMEKTKNRPDGKYELRQLVNDSKGFGIKINRPNIKHINKEFYIHDNEIYFGLSDIKGIGQSHSDDFLAIKEKYSNIISEMSWFEILIFILEETKSSTVQKGLIGSGAIPGNRHRMLYELDIWNKLTDREKKWIIGKNGTPVFISLEKAIESLLHSGYVNKSRYSKIFEELGLLKNPPYPLKDDDNWIIRTEQELLGVPLSISRIDNSNLPNTTCEQASKYNGSNEIVVGAEIQRVKEITTKKGDTMAFITVTDGTELECIAFSEVWQNDGYMLYENNCVALAIEKSNKGKGFKINKVYQL